MIKDKTPYRILVIEDNPGDFIIVEDFLAEQLTEPLIEHAVNFRQASEILVATDLVFDVILLDITLPDKSGQYLITEMLRLAALSPVIVLTGFADIDFSIKSIVQGISDYLLKDDLNASMLYKSILYAINRKKNIAELKESEKRYSDLFNLSPQPMWVFDPGTFRFVQVNKATINLYGYSEAEFMNMGLMDIKLVEDIPEAKVNLSRPVSASRDFKKTVMHQKKNGETMEMEIYGTPITINNKKLRSVLAIDVTEKNRYEHSIIKAIIRTQEDERYEIGGELHDNICQILATSQISLGMLRNSIAPQKLILYNQVGDYINMAIEEIRNISHRLAPAFFNDSTLEEAFGRLLDNFNQEKKYRICLHFSDPAKNYRVSLEIQLNLYRILQEQLKNIHKYSKATLVEVDVAIVNNKLVMRIADDGVGFDICTVKRGIGLANIKRRAELFYGKCELTSSPGKGCEILTSIPLPEFSNLDAPPASELRQAVKN